MENNFRLVSMLLEPKGNYTIEDDAQAVADYERLLNDDANSVEILQKYEVDSDNYMTFNTNSNYVIDYDVEGFYLYKKVAQ
jgi:hypothetical protein